MKLGRLPAVFNMRFQQHCFLKRLTEPGEIGVFARHFSYRTAVIFEDMSHRLMQFWLITMLITADLAVNKVVEFCSIKN